jgi:putative transcriptional regulator
MKSSKFLVASPAIFGDHHFQRSVILLTEEKDSGTVGFIINKKMEYALDELMEGIDTPFPLFYGGPVEPDNLFYIHRAADRIPNSIPIDDTWFWCGDFKALKQLVNTKELTQTDIRFFLGYSGWSAGQLEDELESNSWLVFKKKLAFDWMITPPKTLWKKLIQSIGGNYILWANAPENPIHN